MRHPTDGNAIAADAHCDQPDEIGHEDGETCNRVQEPDGDAPRGYKPKTCKGGMQTYWDGCGDRWIECDTCGEIGE